MVTPTPRPPFMKSLFIFFVHFLSEKIYDFFSRDGFPYHLIVDTNVEVKISGQCSKEKTISCPASTSKVTSPLLYTASCRYMIYFLNFLWSVGLCLWIL